MIKLKKIAFASFIFFTSFILIISARSDNLPGKMHKSSIQKFFHSRIWSEPTNISISTAWSLFPQITKDRNGNIITMWIDENKIIFTYYNGYEWKQPTIVDTTHYTWNNIYFIKDHSENLYLLNSKDFPGRIYLRKWNDTTWAEKELIYNTDNDTILVTDISGLSDNNNSLHVVWSEVKIGAITNWLLPIYYLKIHNGEGGEVIKIFDTHFPPNLEDLPSNPEIALDKNSGTLHFFCNNNRFSDWDLFIPVGIRWRYISDEKFSPDTVIVKYPFYYGGQYTTYFSENYVNLIWIFAGKIFHKYFNGKEWSEPEELFEEAGLGAITTKVDDYGRVHLLWISSIDSTTLNYTYLDNGKWSGRTFSIPQSKNFPYTLIYGKPSIYIDNEKIHILFSGYTSSNGRSNYEIFYTSAYLDTLTALKNDNLILYSTNPRNFQLLHNYPNPFNTTTRIGYFLYSDMKIKLEILNISGNLIKTLVNGHQNAGLHEVVWNGENNYGKIVSSGIYFYKLQIPGKYKIGKMLIIR